MRLHAVAEALDRLTPGSRVYVGAASVEPLALHDALTADPARAAGVDFVGSFVPGVNGFDYAATHDAARMTTLLLPPSARASFRDGRVRTLPLSYAGFASWLAAHPVDVAIVQVTPPDAHGRCSLGPCADFAPVVWKDAGTRIAFVNPSLPRPAGGWTVAADEIDVAVACDHLPIALPPAPGTPAMAALAAHAAALVPDGAAIQAGLGGAPAAILAELADRRDLRIHSGMIGDEVMALAAAGALAQATHRVGVAIGSAALYDWLVERPDFRFVPTPQTHGAPALAGVPGLIAINSALEVDLFGQANLEWRGSQLASGIGGAPDFVRGARLSDGGKAIVALPATIKGRSRIVARIPAPTVSLARNDLDIVVTEHGAASIRALSLHERAEALIAIAAPDHRVALTDAWRDMAAHF